MGENIENKPPEFKREIVDVTIPVGSSTKFLVQIISSSELKVSFNENCGGLMSILCLLKKVLIFNKHVELLKF